MLAEAWKVKVLRWPVWPSHTLPHTVPLQSRDDIEILYRLRVKLCMWKSLAQGDITHKTWHFTAINSEAKSCVLRRSNYLCYYDERRFNSKKAICLWGVHSSYLCTTGTLRYSFNSLDQIQTHYFLSFCVPTVKSLLSHYLIIATSTYMCVNATKKLVSLWPLIQLTPLKL